MAAGLTTPHSAVPDGHKQAIALLLHRPVAHVSAQFPQMEALVLELHRRKLAREDLAGVVAAPQAPARFAGPGTATVIGSASNES